MASPVFTEAWYASDQLMRVARLARSTNGVEGLAAEFGAWEGRSAIALAAAVAPATLYAVDTWLGSQNGDPNDPTAYLASKRDVYERFKANVAAAGLTNVEPMRMDWRDFLANYAGSFRFTHWDAEHDPISVEEAVSTSLPRMVAGGVMAGDDWGWPSVQEGLRLAGVLSRVKHISNLWWIQF